MKPILFRAIAINTGEMVKSMTISKGTIKRKKDCVYFEIYGNWIGVIPETVGEIIGKKDKKGVQIFTGDIVIAKGTKTVKVKDYSKARLYVSSNIKDKFETIEEKAVFVCDWDNTFSSFSFVSNTHSINLDIGKMDYKIIGNIHQNKDLL